MKTKLSFSNHLVIGVMLFALFFGAGNLIFPASLGQNAGTKLWIASYWIFNNRNWVTIFRNLSNGILRK